MTRPFMSFEPISVHLGEGTMDWLRLLGKQWQHSEEYMCCLQKIAMRDYQESVTTGQTYSHTDRQTPDKVIPMCSYASQVTQKHGLVTEFDINFPIQTCGRGCCSSGGCCSTWRACHSIICQCQCGVHVGTAQQRNGRLVGRRQGQLQQ